MNYSVTVDGNIRSKFNAAPDDTILQAALRAGLGFPYECNSGSCGSCRFEAVSGRIEDLFPDAPGLGPRARQRGLRLACQSRPRSDCVIRVRFRDAYVPAITPTRYITSFLGWEKLTPDMAEFRFRTQSEPAIFLPGQYALLQLPGVQRARAYSMSNLSNDDGLWKFIVKKVPGGAGTSALFERLAVGDHVGLDGPFGNAYLRKGSCRDLICIAGGSGLSPILSIVSAAVREPKLHERNITVFVGGRAPEDICWPYLIERDPVINDRVRSIYAISETYSDGCWRGERGYIHEIAKRKLKVWGCDLKNCDFYFCGPPAMTDAVQRWLAVEANVSPAQMYFDRFF